MTLDDLFKAITDTAKSLATVVQQVAQLVVTKQWSQLLCLLVVVIYVLFTPPEWNLISVLSDGQAGLLVGIFERWGTAGDLPSWYVPVFVAVEVGLLGLALGVAIRSLPKPDGVTAADLAERTAIKGLRPFERKDAEI